MYIVHIQIIKKNKLANIIKNYLKPTINQEKLIDLPIILLKNLQFKFFFYLVKKRQT